MRAIVYKEYGPPSVLSLAEVPSPTPAKGQVLIRVRAVEATKSDCELRSFHFPVQWFSPLLRMAWGLRRPKKQVLGAYFAGEVEALGAGVTHFKRGDAVFGTTGLRMGAYAEFVCVPTKGAIALKPTNMSFEDAAAVPLGGFNALHYMRMAKVQKGESVLINGAGGSIGAFAVQLAKSLGAEVTAVDSSIKEQILRGLGADHFIDYAREDFTQTDRKYDVIFSIVVSDSYDACLGALKANGRYLMANPRLSQMLRSVPSTWFSDKTVLFAFAPEREKELLVLKGMIEEGVIGSTLDVVFPLEQAADAHRRVEAEERLGSVVISL